MSEFTASQIVARRNFIYISSSHIRKDYGINKSLEPFQDFYCSLKLPLLLILCSMKTKSFFGILILFLFVISFASCDKDDVRELTPEALYQTSWRGTGHCEAWAGQNMGVGIQFVDTQKGKVLWEGYDEIDITYTIEGKYITFNSNALYLGGAPWTIKSYTASHITLIQNEASPDKEKIATIELNLLY